MRGWPLGLPSPYCADRHAHQWSHADHRHIEPLGCCPYDVFHTCIMPHWHFFCNSCIFSLDRTVPMWHYGNVRSNEINTKLTEQKLSEICRENGLEATRENMALAAFLNDADFRERITRFYFERALAEVAAAH